MKIMWSMRDTSGLCSAYCTQHRDHLTLVNANAHWTDPPGSEEMDLNPDEVKSFPGIITVGCARFDSQLRVSLDLRTVVFNSNFWCLKKRWGFGGWVTYRVHQGGYTIRQNHLIPNGLLESSKIHNEFLVVRGIPQRSGAHRQNFITWMTG